MITNLKYLDTIDTKKNMLLPDSQNDYTSISFRKLIRLLLYVNGNHKNNEFGET